MTQEDRAFIVVCTASIISVVVFTDEWFRTCMLTAWAGMMFFAIIRAVLSWTIEHRDRKGKSRASASRRLHDACAAQMREDGKENLP